jgi:hypothetical protein
MNLRRIIDMYRKAQKDKLCMHNIQDVCQCNCGIWSSYITRQELVELNASQEDTGPAPRFY